MKNLLTITGGIVTMTAQTAATPKEMANSVVGRFSALAKAHGLIRRTADVQNRNGNLENAIKLILLPYDRDTGSKRHSTLSGPDVELGENALTSLALVFHELATNAAKYGALSTPQGHVHALWNVEAARLSMSSRGKPAPHRQGLTQDARLRRQTCSAQRPAVGRRAVLRLAARSHARRFLEFRWTGFHAEPSRLVRSDSISRVTCSGCTAC